MSLVEKDFEQQKNTRMQGNLSIINVFSSECFAENETEDVVPR